MNLPKTIRNCFPGIIIIISGFIMSSCFTGIESTKKITISRDDRKLLKPTAEEQFMDSVKSYPLSDWKNNKEFYVADNKGALIYECLSDLTLRGKSPLRGDTLYFDSVKTSLKPDGTESCIIFLRNNDNLFSYNTNLPPARALAEIGSDALPILIDIDMVNSSRELLKGKRLWTRTPLSYDSKGSRKTGKKYIEVKVNEVSVGDMVFPLTLQVEDMDGNVSNILMNTGVTGNESRSFPNLFYLSDIKNKYPHISEENWNLIQEGKVRNGMTKEECRLSLGSPADVSVGHDYSQTLDLWKYNNGIVLYFEDGLLVNFR